MKLLVHLACTLVRRVLPEIELYFDLEDDDYYDHRRTGQRPEEDPSEEGPAALKKA